MGNDRGGRFKGDWKKCAPVQSDWANPVHILRHAVQESLYTPPLHVGKQIDDNTTLNAYLISQEGIVCV